MNNDNLKILAEDLVAKAKQKGASQVEVSIGSSNDFEVQIMNGEIEKLNQAGSKGISFKVIVDNKVAEASSSDFNESTLNKLLENAILRARLSSEDPYSALPEKEDLTINVDSLGLYDENIITLSADKKIAFAKEIERIGLGNSQIKNSGGTYYSTSFGETILASSNGFSGSYKYTSCGAGGGFQSGDGDNLVEDYWGESVLNLSKMKTPEYIANKAVERVTKMIGARKIPSQVVPIVFDPQMTASLLGFFAGCISGSAIYMNRSFLVGKINQKIANDLLTIIDDGLMPGALGTRPFDSEGVPSRKTVLMENGYLKDYLLGTYSAKKLNMKSNAHAGGTTNFFLQAGTSTPQEIIKSVDKGLYLTKTIGQGTMPTTGDISKGAYGLWIENGELTYPVSEITFSGNLGKMLNDIEMVGNDLEFRRSIAGPTIKINNMSISGT